MGIYGIKPWFRAQLQPIIKLLWNVHPDVLTWSALGLSCLAGYLLYMSFFVPGFALLVIPILFIRLALNALDGLLAQQTGKARAAGEVLNEMTDRVADIAIFSGMAMCPLTDKLMGFIAIICILMVSYTGILGKAVGTERVYSGILGKADRMILLMLTCLIYAFNPDKVFMGLSAYSWLFLLFIPLSSITILQRLLRILTLLAKKESQV